MEDVVTADGPPAMGDVREVSLDDLRLDPENARVHGDENLAAIKASLKRFGQQQVVLVTPPPESVVVVGNGRVAAMRELGWKTCRVAVTTLNADEASAYAIADNRTAELAEWDVDRLRASMDALGEYDPQAAASTGWDSEALAALATPEPSPTTLVDSDPPPLPKDPTTKPGDVWTLGKHRLVCGDARDQGCYHALGLSSPKGGSGRVDLVWTDPPYGVNYEGKTEDALTIQNDGFTGDRLEGLLRATLTPTLRVCRDGAVWYVAAPAGPNFLPFAQVLDGLGVWRQTLVWLKQTLVLGRSDYHYRHEAVFYGWKPGAAHSPPPDRKQDSVLAFDRPTASREHPTMKPLALVEYCLRMSSKPGDTVMDPFGGSGTTLLAAESTGRCARLIELSPAYCDVAVKRWEDATGESAARTRAPEA